MNSNKDYPACAKPNKKTIVQIYILNTHYTHYHSMHIITVCTAGIDGLINQ